MNRQITQVSLFALLLIVALIAATTYWQTWATAGLADKQDNAIQRVAQFTIKRGYIYAADGKTVLARNTAKKVQGKTFYFRRYPKGRLAANVVGYSTQSYSRTGIERSLNSYLTASNANLNTVISKTWDKLKGATVTGNNVVLNIRPGAQYVAQTALRGNCGAVVALEPATGKVLAMATSPTYDPNDIERHYAKVVSQGGPCQPSSPLYDRATIGLYAPGSTFKVVTTTAALDSGKFNVDSTFDDKGYCVEYGKQVRNYGDQGGPEVFGHVSFTQALQHSINAVYCDIGKALGPTLLLDYAKRFGFYRAPGLELPRSEQARSGLYVNHKPWLPKHPYDVDVGRLAFGQERLLATPLQMAEVAAAVANGGRLMQPYLVDRVTTPGSKGIVYRTKPQEIDRVMKPETAATVTRMMEAVVTGGTGTKAQIEGVPVAGKTGTAESGVEHRNTDWFIAFAPADHPKVAVAVVLENQSLTGGDVCAPIAKRVMQALLHLRANT